MRVGAIFPQTEIGSDPTAIRTFATSVEAAGFDHILVYDHVVGADPAHHLGWDGFYTHEDPFHEPFVLFGYLAAVCTLELVTGILILPQRQTVLVAKQAAEVDILSGGRLRLGVGIGWNPVEYVALGMPFNTRGRRIEQQVDVLRRLWTAPVVDISGPGDRVPGAGIAPLPLQRPIPLWFGASVEKALRRVGRLADGWIAGERPGPGLDAALDVIRSSAREHGRDPGALGVEGRIHVGDFDRERVLRDARAWRAAGATHVTLHTMRAGLVTLDDHLDVLTRGLHAVREVAG